MLLEELYGDGQFGESDIEKLCTNIQSLAKKYELATLNISSVYFHELKISTNLRQNLFYLIAKLSNFIEHISNQLK